MRIYDRLLKQIHCDKSLILSQSFITFRSNWTNYLHGLKLDASVCRLSPFMSAALNYTDNADVNPVYGIASYESPKVWVAPYGHQLEFMNMINKQRSYKPFLDFHGLIQDPLPGILHYIGYFPLTGYHQLYYYLGKSTSQMANYVPAPLLRELGGDNKLEPDYYGISQTYDDLWQPMKTNIYLIRTPFETAYNLIHKEIPDIYKYINKKNPPKYVNLSYRGNTYRGNTYRGKTYRGKTYPHSVTLDTNDLDFSVSWLHHIHHHCLKH